VEAAAPATAFELGGLWLRGRDLTIVAPGPVTRSTTRSRSTCSTTSTHVRLVRPGTLDLAAVDPASTALAGVPERIPDVVGTDRGAVAPPPLVPGWPG
jgi:hypothetical protein